MVFTADYLYPLVVAIGNNYNACSGPETPRLWIKSAECFSAIYRVLPKGFLLTRFHKVTFGNSPSCQTFMPKKKAFQKRNCNQFVAF